MKSHHFFIVLFLCSSISLFAMGGKDADPKKVVVYAYDSFTAEWGMGPEVVKQFERQTGYTVELVTCADGQDVLSKAVAEKAVPYADVLLGIDNVLADRAVSEGVLTPYKPTDADTIIPKDVQPQGEWFLTPFDRGYFAIMFDTEAGIPAPKSLEDLTKPVYEKSLVLMDPRTSTPGLGFLAWTRAVYQDEYLDFWNRLAPSVLTMSPNWSTGYGLFTSGEAPLVISYTTSMAYHIRYDKTDRYRALEFTDGHVMQVESMGLVNHAPNAAGGKAFIDFMLSKTAQDILPETQWMYPVSKEASLPSSFTEIPLPKKIVNIPAKDVRNSIAPLFEALAQ